MSTNLQSNVSAGISPAGLPHGASHGVDPACTDCAPVGNPVLRIDIPGINVPEIAGRPAVADETAEPVDSSTSASPEEASPEETPRQAVVDVASTGLIETILAAKAVQVQVEVRFPDASPRHNFRLDVSEEGQRHSIPDHRPIDLSAFTASEEDLLSRCLQRSLPPAYVDAVIRIVSRSREEMVGELENCLSQRTRQLHQAIGAIQNLIQEKNELARKAVRLDRVRGNLNEVHTTLKGVHHEMSNRKTTR